MPPPFASISAVARNEEHTGVTFPAQFCSLSTRDCPVLSGVGVRAKRLLGLKNINVYALGLYVHPSAAKKALHKHKTSEGSSQAMFDDLVAADMEKTLRLVITFGSLKRGQFLSALDERLAPACKKAGATPALESFKAQFDGILFHKGLEIAFTTAGNGTLHTKVEGKEVGTIDSKPLTRALFDIYVGPDPVSPDAKASFGQGLVSLLRG